MEGPCRRATRVYTHISQTISSGGSDWFLGRRPIEGLFCGSTVGLFCGSTVNCGAFRLEPATLGKTFIHLSADRCAILVRHVQPQKGSPILLAGVFEWWHGA